MVGGVEGVVDRSVGHVARWRVDTGQVGVGQVSRGRGLALATRQHLQFYQRVTYLAGGGWRVPRCFIVPPTARELINGR